MQSLGQIAGLWRYPVKSLIGESRDSIQFEPRGVVGDRMLAVVTDEGKIGSHKATNRFRPIQGLFDLTAFTDAENDTTVIRFPDGKLYPHDHPQIDQLLTEQLAQPVTLRVETSTAYHDDGPVHIITSAGLNWLQAQLPTTDIDPRRFRANVLIDCEGNGPVESDWIGRTLKIGPVKLEITGPTERCVMTTLAQDDLPNEPAIARILADQRNNQFGVYARVTFPGTIGSGDVVLK